MLILVKQFYKEAIALEVHPSDTVFMVKAKIQEREGTPVDLQRLIFAGKQLLDQCSLEDSDVHSECVIHLLLRPRPRDECIQVQMLNGRTLMLDVELSDTIRTVKRKIMEKESIPQDTQLDMQRLIFKGSLLQDHCTLSECGVVWKSTLFFVPRPPRRPMHVCVKTLRGKVIPVDVDREDTVGCMKLSIQKKEGIPVAQQRLILNAAQLEDKRRLSSYNLKPESVVYLVLPQGHFSSSSSNVNQAVEGSCEAVGACGLINLGNTCFMNSTLQALSNTVALRTYYRSGAFEPEISNSPLSTKGRLASGFAEFLRMMWGNKHTALSPARIKNLLAERRPEFGNYQQHDAQEVLAFFLDSLHEDVNRAVYPRPMVQDPSTDNKSDEQIALEAWTGFLKRNDSRIVDIFQFQVRSEIKFPEINAKPSLKFDPMMYLSLSVPKPPHTVKVMVAPLGYPDVVPHRRSFQITEDRSFKDLEAMIAEVVPTQEGTGPRSFAFATTYCKRVYRMYEPTQKVREIRSFDDVWCFEVKLEVEHEVHDFRVVHIRKRATTASANLTAFDCFAPPVMIAIRPNVTTNADVQQRLMAVAERFKLFFEEPDAEVSVTKTLLQSGEEGTPLDAEDELCTGEAFALNFLDLSVIPGKGRQLPDPVKEVSDSTSEMCVELRQCLDAFAREEVLAEEDWVKCETTCKKEPSVKRLDMWTAPDCLLVHLKRFGSDSLNGPLEKIDTFVKFPLDLDLSKWIRGPVSARGTHYKLYAVVNHSGSMSFGHYTACGRVGEGSDRQWFLFNDSTVTRTEESEVVTKAAYILFYERVSKTCSSAASDPTSSEEEVSAT